MVAHVLFVNAKSLVTLANLFQIDLSFASQVWRFFKQTLRYGETVTDAAAAGRGEHIVMARSIMRNSDFKEVLSDLDAAAVADVRSAIAVGRCDATLFQSVQVPLVARFRCFFRDEFLPSENFRRYVASLRLPDDVRAGMNFEIGVGMEIVGDAKNDNGDDDDDCGDDDKTGRNHDDDDAVRGIIASDGSGSAADTLSAGDDGAARALHATATAETGRRKPTTRPPKKAVVAPSSTANVDAVNSARPVIKRDRKAVKSIIDVRSLGLDDVRQLQAGYDSNADYESADDVSDASDNDAVSSSDGDGDDGERNR